MDQEKLDRIEKLKSEYETQKAIRTVADGKIKVLREELAELAGFKKEHGSSRMFGMKFNRPPKWSFNQEAIADAIEGAEFTDEQIERCVRAKYEPVMAGIKELRDEDPETAKRFSKIMMMKPGSVSLDIVREEADSGV